MKIWCSCALLFSAIVPSAATADRTFDACERQLSKKATVDSQLGVCGYAWLLREEARLKFAWKQALSEAGGAHSEQGQALLDEQRAWIAFKEKACRRYDLMTAGTLGRFHDASVCRAEIIEDRISELSGDLHGKSLS